MLSLFNKDCRVSAYTAGFWCSLRKRSSQAALCGIPAPRAADQVAILFASGAHAGFDQLAEAAARLRTQFPSLQHVVGTAVRASLLRFSGQPCPACGGCGTAAKPSAIPYPINM